MTLSIAAITFDCQHAADLAAFWSAALDRPVDPRDPDTAEFFASIGAAEPEPGQVSMLFIKVPESKTVKNRAHIDLNTEDRAAEVERLIGLGASVVHDKEEWGVRWTTMTDPEGNEFCVATH